MPRAGVSSVIFYRQAVRAVITGKSNWRPFPDLRDTTTVTAGEKAAGRSQVTRRLVHKVERLREFDPHIVSLDLHGEARLLDARSEGVPPGRHVELPSVPRTGHDAA